MHRHHIQGTILLFGMMLGGCGSDTETRVIEQSVSPDGAWVARLLDEHHFGPGTAGDVLRVTLNRKEVDREAQDILLLRPSDTEPYPGRPASHVQLHWLAPDHLSVIYREATAEMVMVRYAGINISSTNQP
jgi:hypothetical protein